ncbi:MAG: ion channel [Pseudomonadota bacterium]|jgi:MFS family permease
MPGFETQLQFNLAIGGALVAATVLVHFWGLFALSWLMNRHGHRLRPHASHFRQMTAILLVVFGIFLLHCIEIWLYALLYLGIGEMDALEEALYFSTACFTTLGFGDLVLTPRWRLVSAIEGANGWILFAWSTAFLLAVTGKLRLLEHRWLDRE